MECRQRESSIGHTHTADAGYLLGFRSVGLVQEHAAARILQDLVAALEPQSLEIELVYRVRGGLTTSVRLQTP